MLTRSRTEPSAGVAAARGRQVLDGAADGSGEAGDGGQYTVHHWGEHATFPGPQPPSLTAL